jgi:hypothetical protein
MRRAAHDHRRAGHYQDADRARPGAGHALVDPVDGPGNGHEPDGHLADLAGLRHQAALSLAGTFKLSSDPEFIAKVRDIAGLYLTRRTRR